MRTLRTVAELRTALAPARRAGRTIGLVPTMGALHEGHLALIRRAREQCDVVVVSLFVNPAQFNESADLERYPRRERDDAGLAAEAGADLLFAPAVDEVYPPGFATAVEVLGLTDRLEGASRGASHFRGVTTVVTKLLCMASPDMLYLGQKDAQQVLVIRRLVSRSEPAGRDRGAADGARARRPGALQPQRPARRPGARPARAGAVRRAARRRGAGGDRRARRRRSCSARPRAALAPFERARRSTWSSSTPTRWSRSTSSTARPCWRSPRRSAGCG